MSEEAKPCPFCAKPMSLCADKDGEFWMHPGTVADGGCLMSGHGIFPRNLGLWNTRTPPPPSLHREPIEADREAAADLEDWERDDSKRERFMSGEFDDTFAVQAFMRHRLAFSTPAASDAEAWRTIATAPKDGTSVLLWRDDWGDPIMGRWVCCYDFLTDREIEASGMDDDALSRQDWFAADFCQGSRLEGDQFPTHWMPLPATPSTEGRNGEDQADG